MIKIYGDAILSAILAHFGSLFFIKILIYKWLDKNIGSLVSSGTHSREPNTTTTRRVLQLTCHCKSQTKTKTYFPNPEYFISFARQIIPPK
jgi:hypothetical protein